MDSVKSLEIQCSECFTWFKSPIMFGDIESFDSSTMIGNSVQCPNCHKMVGCNKENMRVFAANGGFKGKDTK